MNYINKREKRVRIGIIRDLIRLDMLHCRPISQQRDTAELVASLTTRRIAVAQAETMTCPTEHAQK